jgi:CelD/BcsL family acetyltransferase involved in cellulose biosynthesis
MDWLGLLLSPSPARPSALIAGAAERAAPTDAGRVPRCVVVTDLADAERVRPEWNALLERAFRNELTLSPDWLLTWWRVYGGWQGRRLRLGLFHENGRLLGLAPLLLRRHWYGGGLPFRRLELLASGEPAEHGIYTNHLSILAERGAEEEVAGRLVRAIGEGAFGGWDDTPMPGLLVNAFRAAGIAVELTEMACAPYASLPATWDAYLHDLGKSRRRNILRPLKALEAWAGGDLQLERATDLVSLQKGKAILIDLHRARWIEEGQPGVFRSPFYLRFHDALMRRMLENGNLELLWLRAGEQPLAALYGLAWGGKMYAYQTGRRPDLPGHLRPGLVLMALAIRRAIEEGRREFDLLADDMFYKRQLARSVRPLVRIRATRPSLVEGVRHGAQACRRFLNRLRHTPASTPPAPQETVACGEEAEG